MRVGIIGGGATGLAAAFELANRGHRTAVYERAPFLGGHASTFDVGGTPLERGYHHLFTICACDQRRGANLSPPSGEPRLLRDHGDSDRGRP